MTYLFKLCFLCLILIVTFSNCNNNQKKKIGNLTVSEQDSFESVEDTWYLTTSKNKEKNVELFVRETGVGDTIVVIHGGFGAEHSYLLNLFNRMERDFHIVYYDQRGSLRSPASDTLITAMSHIEDLEKLRKELNINKLNLFGHSMGTWIASAYLDKYPKNVKQMTLLGLVWPRLRENMTDEEKALDDKASDEWATFMNRDDIQQQIKLEGLDKDSLNSREATYKWRIRFAGVNMYDVSNWRQLKGGQVFYNQKAGTAAGTTMPEEYDWIETYKNNPQVPITVINGTHDFVDFGGRLHSKWLQSLSNVSYHLIEKAGHNTWLDHPEKIKNSVKNSFKDNSKK